MSFKVRSRHRRFCDVLLKESIGRPTPWWAAIDTLAGLLGMSHEAVFAVAYDCEKAGLVRYYRSESMKAAWLALELPHRVCLTDEGWRLMRKPRSRNIGQQSTPKFRRGAPKS